MTTPIPEGRQARMLADQAIQRASGRQDAIPDSDQIMREPGSRYIDFLIPGLIGMGIMGNSIWGPGFSIVDARRKKLMKRIVATPMPKHYYLLVVLAVADDPAAGGRRGAAGGSESGCSAFPCEGLSWRWWECACWRRSPSAREDS